ncbi:MAG: cysteine desulfurase family protein [Phycisphaerae bacterium]
MDTWVYFDNNATTQPLPEVVDAMQPFLRDVFANPSSVHTFGQSVRHRVECAREQVARLLGAGPKEIVFTSGGTESINLAIRGTVAADPTRRKIVTTAVEHPAVLAVADDLARSGYTIDRVGVDRAGRLDEASLERKLTADTALLSIIHANNETGVMFDVARLAALATDRGIPVHVDAVQSAGKVPIDVASWPVQLVSLAAHKFHGPKGAGALYVRRRTRLMPLIIGGGQERDRRGGTENVAAIVGMGVAAAAAARDMATTRGFVRGLRDTLEAGVCERISYASVVGDGADRIDNTCNIAFEGLEAEAILILLSQAGICASSGAACSSGSLEPSHVLAAMGIPQRVAHGAIRFSVSRFNTREEVDRVVDIMPELLSRLTVLSR